MYILQLNKSKFSTGFPIVIKILSIGQVKRIHNTGGHQLHLHVCGIVLGNNQIYLSLHSSLVAIRLMPTVTVCTWLK